MFENKIDKVIKYIRHIKLIRTMFIKKKFNFNYKQQPQPQILNDEQKMQLINQIYQQSDYILTNDIIKQLGTTYTVMAIQVLFDNNKKITKDIMSQLNIIEMCQENIIMNMMNMTEFKKYIYWKIICQDLTYDELNALNKSNIHYDIKLTLIIKTLTYLVQRSSYNTLNFELYYDNSNMHILDKYPYESFLNNVLNNKQEGYILKNKKDIEIVFDVIIKQILDFINLIDYVNIDAILDLTKILKQLYKSYPNCHNCLIYYPLKYQTMIYLTYHIQLHNDIIQIYKKRIMQQIMFNHLSCGCKLINENTELTMNTTDKTFILAGSDFMPFKYKSCKKKGLLHVGHCNPIFENNQIIDVKYYDNGNIKCLNNNYLKCFKFKQPSYQKYILDKYEIDHFINDDTISYINTDDNYDLNDHIIIYGKQNTSLIHKNIMDNINRNRDETGDKYKIKIGDILFLNYNVIIANKSIMLNDIFKFDIDHVKKLYDYDNYINTYTSIDNDFKNIKNTNNTGLLMTYYISNIPNIGIHTKNIYDNNIKCNYVKVIKDLLNITSNYYSKRDKSLFISLIFSYGMCYYKFMSMHTKFCSTFMIKMIDFNTEQLLYYIPITFYVCYNLVYAKLSSSKLSEIDSYSKLKINNYYHIHEDILIGEYLKNNIQQHFTTINYNIILSNGNYTINNNNIVELSNLHNKCYLLKTIISIYKGYNSGIKTHEQFYNILLQNYNLQNKTFDTNELEQCLISILSKIQSWHSDDERFMSTFKNIMTKLITSENILTLDQLV